MGSSSSKFKKYLQNGDEYAAIQVFQNSPEMQHNLDPNCSYGDSLQHNTPLHLAARHAMKPLLRLFLYQLKGNPNKQNAMGETSLHLVCQGDSMSNFANQEKRALLVTLILQWHGESDEKVDLTSVDCEGNTALHYAAATGLKKCVEILISHGAPLFIENKSSETVCDLAEKNKHEDIAQFLEFKMLFSSDVSETLQEISTADMAEETGNGLRAQDLQEAKDQLLVETSDMLHVTLFTAEVLLRNHEWSRQSLLDSWMKDPIACCKDAGVSPPTSALHFSTSQDSLKMCCEQIQNEYQNETLNSPARTVPPKDQAMCDICTMTIHDEKDLIQILCQHQFCKDCWKSYLTAKIVDGEAHNILCPAFDCPHLVPIDVIEKLVSADMVKRYIQFDIKAFVESNPTMKWCPYPSCARAVKLPEFETVNEEILALSYSTLPSLSHSVDCGNGHYFCWECLGEAHAPCGCEKWQEWHQKISEIKPQELKNTFSETEEAENCLWMVTNSKPCPNCKCPIQKNEGCNHMKCTKCKFDYCWVCLEAWKKHSPATGGYFRCNRHDAVQRAEVKTETLINQAEAHNKHMQELKRFLQYYTRFKNHENSYKFEEPFIQTTQEKISVMSARFSNLPMSEMMEFLEDAVYELLRARRILCGSYVYGFYLEDNGYNKTIFEYLQNELEEVTEKLSDAIARSYLQTPQVKIISFTSNVKRKRLDLLTAVLKGLIPPETPPSVRKARKHRLPGLMGMDPIDDPLLSQAILESLENFDPNDPWVKDNQGKHTNVATVCDWPDYDSDEEDLNVALASNLGICSRDGCNRSRVRNCRTGDIHEYCSLYCKHWEVMKHAGAESIVAEIDPAMDMLIALELSKLQMKGSPTVETNDLLQNLGNGEQDESTEAPISRTEDILTTSPDENSELDLNPRFNDQSITQNKSSENLAENTPETNLNEENLSSNDFPNFENVDDIPIPFSTSPHKTTINFYLKDSSDDEDFNSKNLNITSDSINSCKTEKELFKVLQNNAEVKEDDNSASAE